MNDELRDDANVPEDERDTAEWLVVADAAEATNYAREYLYELIREGLIVSRQMRYTKEIYMPSLRKYMERAPGPHQKDEG